jgi:hypothetical protein
MNPGETAASSPSGLPIAMTCSPICTLSESRRFKNENSFDVVFIS